MLYFSASSAAVDPLEVAGELGGCLLTPTATMAEHLRHRLARQGRLVRPDSILTLSRFIEPFVRDVPQVSRARLDRMVARLLDENPPAAFAGLKRSRGLRRTIVSLMEEASSAGASPEAIAAVASGTPAAEAFHAVYAEIAGAVTSRTARLRTAAERIAAAPPRFPLFFVDGFYSLTPAEIEVVRALGPVTVRLPQWAGSVETCQALEQAGFHRTRIEHASPRPRATLVRAASEQQEAEEVARRILALTADGRPFREIGVLLRNEHPYAPLLETTFSRYGIPARFYFQQTLDRQPLIRYYRALLDAIETGWDHETLLAALAMRLSGHGATPDGDRLDFDLRAKMPSAGLPPQLDAWRELGALRAARLTPADWAARLAALRNFAALPAIADSVPHRQIMEWRALAASLEAWPQALEETASLLDPQPLSLAAFREHLDEVVASQTFDTADDRRNVVHVMDVYEARQWKLPVVFVCGLVERGFPQYHSEHPLLNDAQRERLREAGIVLRTSVERQREEEFLFEVAATRASAELYLSHPTTNSKGEETLPSFLVSRFERTHGPARAQAVSSRPAPRFPKVQLRPPAITEAALLKALRRSLATLSPTAIETYLQCPFQFFARQALKLAAPPEPAHERLNFLLQGDILHRTLAESHGAPLLAEEILSGLFAELCQANAVPQGARTEKVRLELAANLRRFLESEPLSGGVVTAVEHSFEQTLKPGLKVRGKIDQVVEVPGKGLVVIDFKYSTRDRIRDRVKSHEKGELVQGGLYLWAAGKLFHQPSAGMLYCGLRGDVAWGGWHLAMPGWDEIGESTGAEQLAHMVAAAVQATTDVADRIAAGEIAAEPADEKKCVWCEFRDGCRVGQTSACAGLQPRPLVSGAAS